MEVAPGTMATEKPKEGVLDQTVRTQKRSRLEQEAVTPRIRGVDDTLQGRIPQSDLTHGPLVDQSGIDG